ADPEVDRVGRVPHEHVGRVFGGATVHRSVLREARQQRGAAPRRLVEHAVDLHRALDAGNADVELFGETVVGRAAVGGALEEKEQGEHGVKLKCGMRNAECGMRNAECGMNGPRWERHLRIVSRPCHSALRILHSAFYSSLSATIGSRLAARRAGQMPKNSPTAALKTNASRIASGEMRVFQWASLDR